MFTAALPFLGQAAAWLGTAAATGLASDALGNAIQGGADFLKPGGFSLDPRLWSPPARKKIDVSTGAVTVTSPDGTQTTRPATQEDFRQLYPGGRGEFLDARKQEAAKARAANVEGLLRDQFNKRHQVDLLAALSPQRVAEITGQSQIQATRDRVQGDVTIANTRAQSEDLRTRADREVGLEGISSQERIAIGNQGLTDFANRQTAGQNWARLALDRARQEDEREAATIGAQRRGFTALSGALAGAADVLTRRM